MSNGHSTSALPGDYIEDVIRIAARASEEIVKIYNTGFTVENKEDDSPLTAADMAAHRTIMDGLRRLTPELPVLSEESSAIPFTTRSQWSCYWLVDPLDGTREFIKRNGEFTVNIALIDDHDPVMGVVYLPVTDVCYYAARGLGAFRLRPGGKPEQLETRATVTGQISAAGSRSHGSERQVRFFETLGPGTEIITAGSSLKFCLVAEGKVDIYPRFGPTSEWDTAAAQCIVEEAGGRVTDLQLQQLRYNCKDSLLNPEFLVIADPGFDWSSVLATADVLPEGEG